MQLSEIERWPIKLPHEAPERDDRNHDDQSQDDCRFVTGSKLSPPTHTSRRFSELTVFIEGPDRILTP